MSELNVYHHELRPNEYAEFYLKYEADKVIADLEESHKMEVEQLLMEIVELKEKLKVQTSIAEEGWKEFRTYHTSYSEAVKELYDKNKELRHNKYKRCLAMARLCHERSLWWYSKGYGFEKYDKFWEKWEKRWLELAEQFKEGV